MKETMYQYLVRMGLTKPDETKLIFYGQEISAAVLKDHIDRIASYLGEQGVKKGDSVGVCLPNIPEAVVAIYAINKIGAIVNSIHPLLSTSAIVGIMKKTNTRILFLMDRFVGKHEKILVEKGIKIISCAPSDFLTGFKKGFVKLLGDKKTPSTVVKYNDCLSSTYYVPTSTDVDAEAVYLHSGGTEGDPKTIVLDNMAFNSLADNIIETACSDYQYNDKDSMLMVLPIFHGFGLGVSLHTIITHGRVVLQPDFSAESVVRNIRRYKVTFLAGIPQMFRKMLDLKSFRGKHLAHLKFIFCGGDRLPDDLKLKFDAVLKKYGSTAEILEGYGLTEATTVVTVNRPGHAKLGSQGQAIVGADIRIIDENNQEVPRGTLGEIIVTCPSNMKRYLGDPESTERCFLDFNGTGYVRTGDVGYIDDEGYLFFKDRSKRVVKIMGVNIFPSEIENIVTNLPEIDSACVVAAEKDGKPCTKLLVVMNPMYKYSSYIEDYIKQHILDNTIKYAVPRIIEPVKELKKTPVGKVDYKAYEK